MWPVSPTPGPDDLEDEDNPWLTGPGYQNSIANCVARWVQAEELYGAGVEALQPLAEELILLARRARQAW
ncbi:hypothetical protein ABZ883_33655 [Streptomyces sp. NPDC046977]|uniref:hypothetical protein n=1 Tax=Streptomyces sp. NPDC046977 TaxID=3154703 RepID=UPI003406A87F